MIDDPWFYVAAVFGVLIAGISKAGFGGATGGLSVGLMALVVAPPQAAAVMLPILLVMDAIGLAVFRGKFDAAHLRVLLPAAVVGIVIGTLTFGWIDARWIRGIIGVEAILFALDRFRRADPARQPLAPSWRRGSFWGAVSGFTSFISHAGGPPLMQYLLPLQLDRVRMVGTTVAYFSVVNFTKLIPYGWLGLLDLGNLKTAALLLPVVPIGYWVGLKLLHGLNQRAFAATLNWLLLLVGIKLLWDSIGGG
ncbi:MAG: sulfite exporter TauE/SafE family protein [Gammaproteobacteria bacterium]|nr:sulfite exporter TauE/SafE family protein [Gammaproteobacteria bacterium]MBU1645751.1 sulfite exporter TauE/SafE family protein [Gammaproteobacteria bacterium]MBU1971259.1 sulfite exporter TauE/SafE family protein [Gammaproteobacteria bacterium]